MPPAAGPGSSSPSPSAPASARPSSIDGRLVPNTELGHLTLRGGDAELWAANSVRERLELDWDEWASRVDEYLRMVEDLLWPDLFIIGGGVSKKADKFLPKMTCRTPVVPAELLNQAGIVGGALAVHRHKDKHGTDGQHTPHDSAKHSTTSTTTDPWLTWRCPGPAETSHGWGGSGPAELVEAVVVDAEVVGDLVDHGDPHLLDDLGLVAASRQIGRRNTVMRSGIGSSPSPTP